MNKRALGRGLERALSEAMGGMGRDKISHASPEALKSAVLSYLKDHTFKAGDIVQWKDGLKNKRTMGPFVVVEVLEEAIYGDEGGQGSPYWREPLDIKLGSIDDDGDFLIYHYDSHRFQPVKNQPA